MSSSNVSIGTLDKAVKDILENYNYEVDKMVQTQLREVGRLTVKELKKTSPKAPKNGGAYANDWKAKFEVDGLNSQVRVYNVNHYQLTHLLEHGHAKVNGGFVPGKPHIKPAQKKAEEKAMELIKEGIESVK